MRLGGCKLKELFEAGFWKTNADPLRIGPNSIDVTLGDQWGVPRAEVAEVDPDNCVDLFRVQTADKYILRPGQFVLGHTQEWFDCAACIQLGAGVHYFAPMYDGRSTIARLGLASHITAGFGDYGFNRQFTLELVNLAKWSIVLSKGMRIGQISFEEIYAPLAYEGKYKDQTGVGLPAPHNT